MTGDRLSSWALHRPWTRFHPRLVTHPSSNAYCPLWSATFLNMFTGYFTIPANTPSDVSEQQGEDPWRNTPVLLVTLMPVCSETLSSPAPQVSFLFICKKCHLMTSPRRLANGSTHNQKSEAASLIAHQPTHSSACYGN